MIRLVFKCKMNIIIQCTTCVQIFTSGKKILNAISLDVFSFPLPPRCPCSARRPRRDQGRHQLCQDGAGDLVAAGQGQRDPDEVHALHGRQQPGEPGQLPLDCSYFCERTASHYFSLICYQCHSLNSCYYIKIHIFYTLMISVLHKVYTV